jgi:hypothetical protein
MSPWPKTPIGPRGDEAAVGTATVRAHLHRLGESVDSTLLVGDRIPATIASSSGCPNPDPDRGRDMPIGGPGRDTIQAAARHRGPRPERRKGLVNCEGGEVAYVDPIDVVRRCEHVHLVDAGDGQRRRSK